MQKTGFCNFVAFHYWFCRCHDVFVSFRWSNAIPRRSFYVLYYFQLFRILTFLWFFKSDNHFDRFRDTAIGTLLQPAEERSACAKECNNGLLSDVAEIKSRKKSGLDETSRSGHILDKRQPLLFAKMKV